MNLSRIMLVGLLAVIAPGIAHAEFTTDLRMKLGSAAEVDRIEFSTGLVGDAAGESGGSFQLELVMTQQSAGSAAFVGSVGLFSRTHGGNVPDPFLPTDIEYAAAGISGSAGISIKASDTVHLEARFELGVGSGEPTLTTPGFQWNAVQEGGYAATSLIFGGYFTTSTPGFQLGLELAAQSFVGDFQIWNNSGYWTDGKVKGGGGTASIVLGYRF